MAALSGSHTLGLLAGLAAAACWALASLVFRRVGHVFSPLQLNLWKGLLAIGVLALWITVRPGIPVMLPSSAWLLLGLGGAIGIGLGDTAYFAALNRLGERNTILVAETLAPLLTLALAGVLLGEWPGLALLLGMGTIMAGVGVALGGGHAGNGLPRRVWHAGLLWALLAALCQALGAVLTRQVFLATPASAADTSLLRLLAGVLLLAILLPLRRQPYLPRPVPARTTLLAVCGGTLLGTVGGIVLQQLAFKHTQAAVAQTALATSVIFVMVFNALQGRPAPLRAWLGGLLAVAGVALLFGVKP